MIKGPVFHHHDNDGFNQIQVSRHIRSFRHTGSTMCLDRENCKTPLLLIPNQPRYNNLKRSLTLITSLTRGTMAKSKHYTPPLNRVNVCALYHQAKQLGIPMTRLANNLIEAGLKESTGW